MRALHDPEPVPLPGPGVAPTSPQPLSVLLVEDDRADALLVEELIADAAVDIRLVWAHSVADAEREIARARPDCVLLDLNLPDASGIDALDHICDCDATLAIVVLTGLFDEHFELASRRWPPVPRIIWSRGVSNPTCYGVRCSMRSSASAPS